MRFASSTHHHCSPCRYTSDSLMKSCKNNCCINIFKHFPHDITYIHAKVHYFPITLSIFKTKAVPLPYKHNIMYVSVLQSCISTFLEYSDRIQCGFVYMLLFYQTLLLTTVGRVYKQYIHRQSSKIDVPPSICMRVFLCVKAK